MIKIGIYRIYNIHMRKKSVAGLIFNLMAEVTIFNLMAESIKIVQIHSICFLYVKIK